QSTNHFSGILAASLELVGQPLLKAPEEKVLLAQRDFPLREVESNDVTSSRPGPSLNIFQLKLFLGDAAALAARERPRTFIFATLVAAAFATAILGFFAARKAFERQVRLSEMKSNFVSSVSHELRAPLASMRLLADGLEEGIIQSPEKQRQYFRFMSQE